MLGVMSFPILSIVRRRPIALALSAFLLAVPSLVALAQESSLRAERVVDYTPGKAAPLNARVGPVSIQSVEFSDRGRSSGQGGFTSRITGGAGTDSEASTTIRSHFLAENPTADEWQVTFTLEFLDKSGKVIDRVTKKSSWEGQAKPFDLDHSLLSYVIPAIAQVRVKLEGRLD